MEEDGMTITVVGVALIIAAAVVVVLLIRALTDNTDRGSEEDQAL